MNEVLVAELGAALSPDRVRIGGTELALYQRDASNLTGQAGVVCFPTSTAEVQAAIRIAVRHNQPFVARGAGTGLAGGATPLPDGLLIVPTKVNRVVARDPVKMPAGGGPGAVN